MPYVLISIDVPFREYYRRTEAGHEFAHEFIASRDAATVFKTRIDAVAAYLAVKDAEEDDPNMPPLRIQWVRK